MEGNTGTCFIGELPDELLVAVTSQFRVQRGFLAEPEAEKDRRCNNAAVVRSLRALTLCCRKLNAIATPFLYQCIIRTKQLITLLLPTLLSNPNLGRHIQYFEAASFEYYDPELYTLNFGDDLTGLVRKKYSERMVRAECIVPDRDSAADSAIRAGRTEPGIGFTMVSVPTLERLQRQVNLSWHGPLIVLLLLAENLQDVAIEGRMGNIIMMALVKLPRPGKLRRLWVWNEGNEWSGYMLRYMCSDAENLIGSLAHYLRSLFLRETMWSEFGPPSTMEELSFTIQDASNGLINDHLRGCASLKTFRCHWQWTDKFSPQNPVELPKLHRSLERFRDSLTSLTIDTTESAWRVDLDTYIPALGSLRDFKVLKYLDVAALVLWGDGDFWEPAPLSELLPESLETLDLKTEWDEDIEDKLYQLSMESTVSLPRLSRVECTWRPAPGFIADLLIDACHLVGIDLVLDVEESVEES